MKKLIAILLSVVLLATMCVSFVAAEGTPDYSAQPFWFTLFNDIWTEGGGYVITDASAYTGQPMNWNINVSFAPVEGTNNVFEVVATSAGKTLGDGDHTTGVPEGGFMYSVNLGNAPYESAASAAAFAQAQTWKVGEKYYIDGLDLTTGEIPTSTPGVNFWTAEYVCTSTITPYVSYDETEYVSDETTGDLGYYVAYGFTFAIDYVDGSIVGEDNTIITSDDAYNACNPNWAISVLLQKTEGDLYEVVGAPVVTPGSAAAAGLTVGEGQLILVAHSSYSRPVEGFDNWSAKIAALALKDGDKVYINEDMTEAYVLMPGEVIETEGEGEGEGGGEEPELSLKDIFDAINGDPINGAAVDVVLDAPETYKAGDEITVTATIDNITVEGGIHYIEFILLFDYEQLTLLNGEDEDGALDCITSAPEGFENLSSVLEEGALNIAALTAEDIAAEDGDLVFTFKFKANEDASEETGAIVPNEDILAAKNIPMSDANPNGGAEEYPGNGSYVILAYDAEGEVEPPKAGDATNAIVFAIVALVSVMGTAIVVKNRK